MNGSREIALTRGKVALVDEADFDWLNQWTWSALECPCSGNRSVFYAYRVQVVDGKQRGILMHRLILGAAKGQITDHRNRDGLDNRRCNLRVCNTAQNSLNRLGYPAEKKTSRFKGVFWDLRNSKWTVQFRHKHVGVFHDEEDAAMAYDLAAFAYSPEFARLNFSHGYAEEKYDL